MSTGTQPPAPAPGIGWPRVKQILDGAIAAWKAKHHRDPDLTGVHGDTFGWDTKDQLKAGEAFGFRLIAPAKVGNGQGAQANLIIALRDPSGVQGNGRMPRGGPFLKDTEINEIVQWIDAGLPD